eukprot:CAMPEP_0202872556 /NCGR_PEP_ID=MMETSP1391-20130828/21490_1 /ASSEMBLY_ACC=CAM_ASM_000867 /TAXON_ID=1034604 /ORGANISM="Chlamydomonas leiostraca, Strain SAG 11-49" /LENGTH=84 /DNA_ID=CAMNT_0049553629 /DNA_START=545 /DNA_END=796 /DNA_ORIENTATION=-
MNATRAALWRAPTSRAASSSAKACAAMAWKRAMAPRCAPPCLSRQLLCAWLWVWAVWPCAPGPGPDTAPVPDPPPVLVPDPAPV